MTSAGGVVLLLYTLVEIQGKKFHVYCKIADYALASP